MQIPQDMLTEMSQEGLRRGIKILQGYRLAPTDAAHVDALLAFMAPPHGTTWADIGCGFGEVARLMYRRRPDLRFVLVNNNAFQLSHAPEAFPVVLADMHDIPLDDASVDGCMFLYSLCHADHVRALGEAARITRPGGSLFVFDYDRAGGDNDLMRSRLYAEAWPLWRTRMHAAAAGWKITDVDMPEGDDTLFRELFETAEEYDGIFAHLEPVLWKAVRV